MRIKQLYIRYLYLNLYFQLLSLFSVIWLLFGTFLFLVCFSIWIIIHIFVAETISKKRRNYATSKEAC